MAGPLTGPGFTDHAHSYRAAPPGAERLAPIDPPTLVEVTVTLAAPDLPATLPERALTPAQFGKAFGADADHRRKVEDGLRAFGLTVASTAGHGRSIRVTGPAGAMEAAFAPRMAVYRGRHGEFRGREGMIRLPADLARLITGVFGFDQRRIAGRHTSGAKVLKSAPLTPDQIERRYNFPTNDAAGQTVAIAAFGRPDHGTGSLVAPAFLLDDVTRFCKLHGRPAPNIETIALNLTPLTATQLNALPPAQRAQCIDASIELMLDVEIAAAFAPGAKLLVYFASFDQKGWVDLLDQVAGGHPASPVSLSISWGGAETNPNLTQAYRDAIGTGIHACAMQGITVCVSTGDDGAGDGADDPNPLAQFPATCPYALAVGGTMLDKAAEVAWWEAPGRRVDGAGGATGGGVSEMFARPGWQTVQVTSLNAGRFDGRVIPDVAALAGPPFYAVALPDGTTFGGGTSAATPLWAALIARINASLPAAKRQRALTPLLYRVLEGTKTLGQMSCRDVTAGSNVSNPHPGVGYQATPGFDAVSGWGVPDGEKLAKALARV